MANEFISINEAVTKYGISQNKARKLVKDNKETKHIKQAKIKGKHGFKYLISVAYLDDMFTTTNKDKTKVKQGENEDKTRVKDNQLVIQLQTENKRLSNQIDKQNETIKDLTTTLQNQQKVVIAQSLQISRLSEPITNHQKSGPENNQRQILTFENIMIMVLVGCIIAIVVYLFQ